MQVTIKRLGHRGDGIADGPIYVAGALPDEVVEGDVQDGRMAAPTVVSASADRVHPDCPHYGTCGGCQVMHASDPFVGRWKIDVVRQALAAHDLPAPIKGIATSPPQSRRRAVLSGRRGKDGAVVGFHGRRSDQIVGVPDCRVLHPDIIAAFPLLRDLTERLAPRGGEMSLTVTTSKNGLDIAITGAGAVAQKTATELVRIVSEAGIARLTVDGDTLLRAVDPAQTVAGVSMVPAPGAFLQATPHGESALIACVSRALGDAGHVVDLFAGCGTFALPISRRAQVHAAEGDKAMTDALLAAWRKGRGHRPLTAETRDLFSDPLTADELSRFDAAVIDPPRAGSEAQMHQIAASKLGRVAAVSCNPVTFARDAKVLTEAGFAMEWIRVVDQFRWSTHVELAAAFTRA
ncbi:23S rRNA (uracil(1939)-C(5))-methyltransferase RlmD [Rhodobacteraceae bacterium THAF1]|uniref:class I SAM-dependent RNA methyltransferase n=1 Tax=Palleronia sp. THAF1 TaxID=2587842 RepID=UPI000F40030D|nr:class I SAM-dependent RNA methyltransferase [Palleronia sp. THAF1]QFU10192.1 23S rRNA (uracil(1939)-C(5))-methyltransferase RlmD [Palleronia sp. THAF1]VDC16903.1 23S rRNA (uracil(1939)-C(5))-methyltransferase RlmD [Rhodobacteraceae bacterium THAF1]